MSNVTVIIGLLLCLQEVDNPSYKSWSKFKVGTKLTIKMESEASGNKTSMEATYELKTVDEKSAEVAVKGKMTAMGNTIDMPERTEKYDAKQKKVDAPPSKAKIEEGDEEIEIAGRKIKCHWTKETTEQGTKRVWVSDEVPGRMVKSEADISGAKTKMWIAALETK